MSWAPSSGWQAGSTPVTPRSRRTLEIAGVVIGFFYFWPASAAYLAWKFAGYPIPKDWARFRDGGFPNPFSGMNFGHMRFGGMGFGSAAFTQTGNRAFDEYRRGEIQRLEAERRKLDEDARAFHDFVDDLKRAKDRDEFDAFMRRRGDGGTTSV